MDGEKFYFHPKTEAVLSSDEIEIIKTEYEKVVSNEGFKGDLQKYISNVWFSDDDKSIKKDEKLYPKLDGGTKEQIKHDQMINNKVREWDGKVKEEKGIKILESKNKKTIEKHKGHQSSSSSSEDEADAYSSSSSSDDENVPVIGSKVLQTNQKKADYSSSDDENLEVIKSKYRITKKIQKENDCHSDCDSENENCEEVNESKGKKKVTIAKGITVDFGNNKKVKIPQDNTKKPSIDMDNINYHIGRMTIGSKKKEEESDDDDENPAPWIQQLNEWSSDQRKNESNNKSSKKVVSKEKERTSEIFSSSGANSNRILKKSSMITASKALKSYVSYSKLKDVNDFLKLKNELEFVSTLVDEKNGSFKKTSKPFEFVNFSKISNLDKGSTIKLLNAINSMLISTQGNDKSDLKTILKLIQKESNSSSISKKENSLVVQKESVSIETKQEGDSAIKFFIKINKDATIMNQFSALYYAIEIEFNLFYEKWISYSGYLMPVFQKLANDLYNDFKSNNKKDKEEKNYKLLKTMLNMFDWFGRSINENTRMNREFLSKNYNLKTAFYSDVIALKESIKNKFGTQIGHKIEKNIFDVISKNDEINQKKIEGFFDYFGNTFVNKLKSLIKEATTKNIKYQNLISDIVLSIINARESDETKMMLVVCLLNFPVICHKYIIEEKVLPCLVGVGGDISSQQADSIFSTSYFESIYFNKDEF